MLDRLKGLVNQLHLFTGIHTAEAEILEDVLNRVDALEKKTAATDKKLDGTTSRVIQVEGVIGEHKRNHPGPSDKFTRP